MKPDPSLATADRIIGHGQLSAGETAFRSVWHLISHGELQPGLIVTEEQLAASLSLSRTPLREAARRLEELGLLLRETGRGLRITPLSLQEMLELSATREAIECVLVAGTARRVGAGLADASALRSIHARLQRVVLLGDAELALEVGVLFHGEIKRLSGNRSASRFHEQVLLAFERYRLLAARSPTRSEIVHAEHTAVLEAVCAGNHAAAEAAMRTHLSKARALYEDVLSTTLPKAAAA